MRCTLPNMRIETAPARRSGLRPFDGDKCRGRPGMPRQEQAISILARVIPVRGRLGSVDQLTQPVSLSAPGVPIIVEFVADQRANLEQPVELRLHLSPFQVRCVPFHRHGGGAVVRCFRGKYAVKLDGVDLVVAGVCPGR